MAKSNPEQEVPAPRLRFIVITGVFTIGTGVLVYRLLEDWSWVDSLYFSVVTLSTVGYGDLTPQSDAAKLFTVFYIIVGIGIFAALVNFLIKRAAVNRLQKRLSRHQDNH